jgi:uncharacterized protein YbjT (DUF2867 family)
MSGPVVIAGASGFVGARLVQRLQQLGHEVRCGTRDPERAARTRPDLTWVRLDVDDPSSLTSALRGASALVYLVHQMRGDTAHLGATETLAAGRVAHAAEHAGLRRIVYLGGPKPTGTPSPHLAARLATGETLRRGRVPTVELRAGMVIGAGSESWTIVRDLALRLPFMVLPSWLERRSEPLAIDDVVSALVRAIDLPIDGSLALDLPGPEAISGRDLLRRIAQQAGFRATMVNVPLLTPSLSSHWIRLVTRADYGIARQLVAGLTADLVCEGPTLWDRCPDLTRTPLDEAIRTALAQEPAAAIGPVGRAWEAIVARVARDVRG